MMRYNLGIIGAGMYGKMMMQRFQKDERANITWVNAASEALEVLIRFTWKYCLKNPEFLTLVNSENLHKARHLKKSDVIQSVSRKFVNMVAEILDRGVASGDFRRGIDPVQLNITIAAIAYYYLTNRFTGSIIFERNLMAPDALDERLSFNIETIMRLVKAD